MKTAIRCLSLLLANALWMLNIHSAAWANVYPTNIKLNGATNNVSMRPGGGVSVSYILNEPATAGVKVEILSDTNVVRAIMAPGAFGTNSVIWDGKDDQGKCIATGTYSLRITACANGFTQWTQTSDDNNPNNYLFEARGLAVNRNPKSPYYGRIFAGNSVVNPYGDNPGDQMGILKWNADGSFADEGGYSSGGYAWTAYYAPWKIEISDDDKVYVIDFSKNGDVLTFDQQISSNSLSHVFGSSNWGTNRCYDGGAVSGTGTNAQLWMTDITPSGAGLVRFNVQADGKVAPGDLGTIVVKAGAGSDLTIAPIDVALDPSNAIYLIQRRAVPGDSAPRVLKFPAYNESGVPEKTASWSVGSGDKGPLLNLMGVAVDPTATYVAAAAQGNTPGLWSQGGVTVFKANDGSTVTNIQFAAEHDAMDVAWDAVGNLLAIDHYANLWRAYSPPGTNQATTVALQTISVQPPTPIVLSGLITSSGAFQLTITGDTNVSYVIQASSDLQTWTPVSTNTSPAAVRRVSLPIPGSNSFYRAVFAP